MSSNNIPPTLLLIVAYVENKVCDFLRWKHFLKILTILDTILLFFYATEYAYFTVCCMDSSWWWEMLNIIAECLILLTTSAGMNLSFMRSDPTKMFIFRYKYSDLLYLLFSALATFPLMQCTSDQLPVFLFVFQITCSFIFLSSRVFILILAHARKFAFDNLSTNSFSA